MLRKDSGSLLFPLANGGNGPPTIGMSYVFHISFIFECGGRLHSSKEQFLIFGGNLEDNLDSVVKFLNILVKDLKKEGFSYCEWFSES